MDDERFYPNRTFYSVKNANEQLQRYLRWDNNFPLLVLGRKSPLQYWRELSAQSVTDQLMMHKIDRIHTDEPTWGYRTITSYLRNAYGMVVNRKRVRRLMRLMGIYAIYPKPSLSKMYHAQYVRPYLLRNMEIVRPDQVWGVDITYIPIGRSFVYLFVIIDWFSRYIVVGNCLQRWTRALCSPVCSERGQMPTRDHQQRSRWSFHKSGLYCSAGGIRCPYFHGRQGAVSG